MRIAPITDKLSYFKFSNYLNVILYCPIGDLLEGVGRPTPYLAKV